MNARDIDAMPPVGDTLAADSLADAAAREGAAGAARAARAAKKAAEKAEWASRPERSNMLALRTIVWVALSLGRGAARVLLVPICLYYLAFAPKVHAASKEFLTRALGRAPNFRDYFRHLFTFAATLLDRVFLLNGQMSRFDVTVYGEELVQDLVKKGEGCFLLGSHLGSFEIIRTLGREAAGLNVSLVMYEENAKKVNAILDAINPDLAVGVIGLGKADSMMKVREALERGEFVGMLGDRNFANEGTVPCQFFGATTHCPLGPFRMAALLRRPVVLMFGLYRGGNRYDIHFEQLTDLSKVPSGQRSKEIERSLQNYVERMEHYCRLAPYNWFNFYGFWDQDLAKTK